MRIEVSNGEILDKLSILEIKKKHIKDEDKLKNICAEFDAILESASEIVEKHQALYKNLLNVNQKLWDIEDAIREKERIKQFDETFIELARSVYVTNDERSVIKKQINLNSGSRFIEEKSYADYK